MRAGHASAWLPWLAGYASLIAGILSLAVVPASAAGANATVILLALAGLCQVLWGAVYILRQASNVAWAGVVLQTAGVASAVLGAVPIPSTGTGIGLGVSVIRVAAGLMCLGVLVGQHRIRSSAASPQGYGSLARLFAAALGSAALLTLAWIAAAGLTLPVLRASSASPPGVAAEATLHPDPHPGAGEAHQSTFRVRLTGEPAGAYIVDAFTGPTEVGHLFIELRVENPAGLALEGLTIRVEALPGDGIGDPLIGTASPELAQIPGDYALSLPVPTAGFWDVAVTIDGPEGQASVGFSERVGGTANVAGWVLAGVPLVIAALFGLLFLRTAGRGRS